MDKRELILLRLLAIGKAIAGIKSGWRNRGELKEDNRPAFVLLDGDETNPLLGSSRGHAAFSTTIMELRPQLFILLVPRDTPKNEGVGEELSSWRAKLLSGLASDQQLVDLIGPNGQIIFRGMQTDMSTGSPLFGELQFDFGIRYVLNPLEL
jgi:hypothetical protein